MSLNNRLAARFVVLATAFIAACSDSSVPGAVSPVAVLPDDAAMQESFEFADGVNSTGVTVAATKYADRAYATKHTRQKLDLYLPTTGKGPFPLVIWIHGGGWWSGDKALSSSSAQLLPVNSGFAVASINYRYSTTAKFPAQIQDVKAAVRWLRANAATFKLDTARFTAWGASAGGHLASLLGTSDGVSALTDLTLGNPGMSERVDAVVDFFGPQSFLTLDTQAPLVGCGLYRSVGYKVASSPPSVLLGASITTVAAKVAQANPASYINSTDAAFMIQHGTKDCLVPYLQSSSFQSSLKAKLPASKVSYTAMAGWNHGDSRFYSATNVAKVITFLKANM